MTLLYFEGFDMHQRVIGGLDPGAGSAQDAGYYWRGGTITFYDFFEGYEEGRAMNVTTSGTNNAGAVSLDGYTGRIGFWGKIDSAFSVNMVDVLRAGLDITFSHAGSGIMRISHTTGGVLGSSAPGVIDDEWAYYEVFCDAPNGIYQFSRNGFMYINATGPVTNSGLTLGVNLGTPSLESGPDFLVDHLWITNGAYPAGTDILGVQVVGALDHLASSNAGFKGSLVIGGTQYQTPLAIALVGSAEGYAGGSNIVNVINYLYATDPSTDLPWTTASYNAIDQWGLCYGWTSSKDETRLAGMCLSYLDDNDGMPLVRYLEVNGMTAFSGPWVKSDPTKTYSSLIGSVPRPFILLEVDAPGLRIADDGCILFNGPAAGAPPDEPLLTSIGLTFAEEFREDYRDFVRVDGGASFESFFISGYSVLGEGNREFQNNYLNINYENVPTGKAYIQGLWDYSENSSTGRWSMRQSLDNIGGDYMHATRRIKIRGHGKALQIKVTNKGDNPFVINGWTALVTSNTSV